MRFRKWCFGFGLAALLGGAAGALEPSFFGEDDRVMLRPVGMPWSAIGKLDFDGDGHCSGAMVSPRVVLTAAHCLYAGNDQLEGDIEYIAGFDRGRDLGRAQVERYWLAPTYDEKAGLSDIGAVDDYAFLLLDRPLGDRVGYLPVHRLTHEDLSRAARGEWRKLVQAGYSGDQPDRLTAHFDCAVLSIVESHRIAHACDIMPGDSGSPILYTDEQGDWHLIAVNSQVYFGPRPKNWAVDSRAFADDLESFIARYDPDN